jgi:uncharacterized protein DUF4926
MIEEFERVVLTSDLPDYDLVAGDIGTVVMIHRDGEGYEVEFIALDGVTLAVVSVLASQIRRIRSGEIAHVRQVEATN